MEHYDSEEIINVGAGVDLTIKELAELVREVVGFRGEIVFDACMPDGTPRKFLDTSRMSALGWSVRIPLREGIQTTYDWYLINRTNAHKYQDVLK
jgi:GDP-L-fucose synthase